MQREPSRVVVYLLMLSFRLEHCTYKRRLSSPKHTACGKTHNMCACVCVMCVFFFLSLPDKTADTFICPSLHSPSAAQQIELHWPPATLLLHKLSLQPISISLISLSLCCLFFWTRKGGGLIGFLSCTDMVHQSASLWPRLWRGRVALSRHHSATGSNAHSHSSYNFTCKFYNKSF